MKKYSIILTFMLLISMNTTAQESKKEQKAQKKIERYQQIKDLVNSGQYEFKGQKANPQKGTQIDLSSRFNFLKVNRDNAAAEMPYFGRAFSGGAYAGGDGGINFDGPMEKYSVNFDDKKRRITVTFNSKGKNDNFSCQLTITSMDNASLFISSNKRQSITYLGNISELSEEK